MTATLTLVVLLACLVVLSLVVRMMRDEKERQRSPRPWRDLT